MLICAICGTTFPKVVVKDGIRLNLRGRKHCLLCRPHHPLRAPRKRVTRAVQTRPCEQCGVSFEAKTIINGARRSLYRRRFCLGCSPFGAHNTSKRPPGSLSPTDLIEQRRKRRNAKTYRYQKKRRTTLKAHLLAERGGCCEQCGYGLAIAALEFHHRDANTKEFQISNTSVSRRRLWSEAAKCDLLCANCHRRRHLTVPHDGDPGVDFRREKKQRAVAALGGHCKGCGSSFPPQLFEFHHLDASTKDFAISADGISRRWEKIEAELAKCVLLCANCHREVHARVRTISEPELPYRIA